MDIPESVAQASSVATCYQHALSVNSYTDEQIGGQMSACLAG
jgi:hypothetical protein